MIAYIEGHVSLIESSYAVVLVNGIGYHLILNKTDLDSLSLGEKINFFVHTNVREDAIDLYGFRQREQKQIFQLLISVSGVGPKLALAILSTLSTPELINALIEKNIAVLSGISGIGKKTAERLILELKEKIQKLNLASLSLPSAIDHSSLTNLHQALKGLGYSKDQCEKALAKIDVQELLHMPLETLIKKSLTVLTGGKTS